jgi:hypothetical protein
VVHIRGLHLFWLLVLCVCLLCGAAFAQLRRIPGQRTRPRGAALFGTVRDQNGRPIPGAAVSARGPVKTFAAICNGEGIFRFVDLPAGTYDLTIEANGYESDDTQKGMVVTAGENTELPLPGGTITLNATK